ncbi:MAG TPA: tripartite tricarboxylate transporter substrate binding protein [Burkholderiales bacterium]|nr:tripartite tricarboxylate transporter substrate binding protein [Burkholderiales bacterium]
MIVPFPPGGSVDAVARLLAPYLQQSLGQQIIVDNRPGASASIGTGIAAKATPDGYTFAIVFDTHGVNPSLIPGLPYDTLKDLQHVMLIGTGPMMITVHPGGPYKNFGDVLAAAKASPGAVSFGTIGSGSLGHLAMTLMGNQAGFQMTHIPYKGGGPLTQDAVAGQVPVAIGTTVLFAQQVAAKRLIPLAVTSPARSPQFPDVPTVSESGIPGFSAVSWWGLVAPAKTPAAISARMHDEVAKALKIPAVRERLEQQGMNIRASSPEEFAKFVGGEITRWNKVVKDNKIEAGA